MAYHAIVKVLVKKVTTTTIYDANIHISCH